MRLPGEASTVPSRSARAVDRLGWSAAVSVSVLGSAGRRLLWPSISHDVPLLPPKHAKQRLRVQLVRRAETNIIA